MKIQTSISKPCLYRGWLFLLAMFLSNIASALPTIEFKPVQGQYTASPNYLATNIWIPNGTRWGFNGPLLYVGTPNPRPDGVCPDQTSNYLGSVAAMTGLGIAVTPNTNYTITAALSAVDFTGWPVDVFPSLSFRVNNQFVAISNMVYGKFFTATGTWNSGSNTAVDSLGIWNSQGAGCGNDFYIGGAPAQPPAIAVSKTASSMPLKQGSKESFTVNIAISGSVTTTPISLTDPLPAGMLLRATPGLIAAATTSSGASLTCTSTAGAAIVSCTVPSGAGVGNIAVNIPVTIDATTASQVTNTASVAGGSDNCTTSTPCQGSVTVPVMKPSPTLSLSKVLGGPRANANDQFTVQIMSGATVVASGTTTGTGATVNPGSGSTGNFVATPGTTYTLAEAGSSGAQLGQYASSLQCSNSGPTNVSTVSALNASITPLQGDAIVCTMTNAPQSITLNMRQLIVSPLPVNMKPPVSVGYTGTNGWGMQSLITTTLNIPVNSTTNTLTAANIDTTLTASFPDSRWIVNSFSCTDANASITGNPGGKLVNTSTGSLTIPATFVKPAAAFKCQIVASHSVP